MAQSCPRCYVWAVRPGESGAATNPGGEYLSQFDSLLFLNGFLVSLGLIIAIGPQNAYVLRKGLVKRHVFWVTTVCFLSDALLILVAAAGVGTLLTRSPALASAAAWGGAAFLLWFGWTSFRAARNPRVLSDKEIGEAGSGARGKGLGAAILMALALTYLNPHVYLDTLVILGSMAAQYDGADRAAFTAGAVAASALWFYGLGYGAAFLAPAFRRPAAWRILDNIIGIIMWSVAAALVWGEINGGGIHR